MLTSSHRDLALAAILALLQTPAAPAANWPQWRGPSFNGATPETNLPPRLDKQDQLLWKTPLPGRSGATPVVWGDAVFLPSSDGEKHLLLFCLDRATGAVRWQRMVAEGDRVVGKNNMASCSAVTDGQRVYALFGTSDFAAFDFQGKELWHVKLKDQFGAFASMFLYGASPLLFADKLYIPLLQRNPATYGHANDGKPERKSWLICVEPPSGKVLWARERTTDALEEAMEAYTTPLPFSAPGGPQVVVAGADCVTAHRPDTGEELWRYPGLNRKKNTGGRIVPSPVADAGLIFVCGPKREMLAAVRPGAGILDDTHVAWKTEQYIPDVSTPLCYQGKLFVLDGDRQVMTCFEPATGRQRWQGRLGIREIFYSSPTGADGKLYCLSEEGTVVVLSAGDRFEVLSTTAFGEGPCRSSIVIADGQFFIRTAQNLYCLGKQ